MARVVASTSSGVSILDLDGRRGLRNLDGRHVRALAPQNWERLWAIVDRREVWRTEGDGWERVASLDDLRGAEDLEAVCLADTRANPLGGILIGTTRARLIRVDEHEDVEFVDAFDRAPDRDRWHTPWGGPPETRSISEDGDHVYVNVHVGGILRSDDEGGSWTPTIDVAADVHQVATGGGRVYAASARGLGVSQDAGNTWRFHAAGLPATYCRAVAVCGARVLISASGGPRGERAALYAGGLDGEAFDRCREGLPEWFDANLDTLCVDALPEGQVAAFGTESGDIYASGDQGRTWNRIATGIGQVTRVLTLP